MALSRLLSRRKPPNSSSISDIGSSWRDLYLGRLWNQLEVEQSRSISVAGGGILGDEDFIKRIAGHLKRPSKEVPRKQRAWKGLASYEREAGDRNRAIRLAYRSGDFTLVQIGEYFDLHYATVSRIARSD